MRAQRVTTWMHANGASVTSARLLAKPKSTDQQSTMVTMAAVQARACTILVEFERARTELVGKAVILTNGKAGTVDRLWLDEFHGLRISIRSQAGNWPVSTIKVAEQWGALDGTRSSRAAVQARPQWVKLRSLGGPPGSRLYLQERTSSDRSRWSVSCQCTKSLRSSPLRGSKSRETGSRWRGQR